MAQPITWRNVAAPDATAAIKGMAYANETLNSALAKAQGTVGTMVDRVATGHADAKDTNTRKTIQAIKGITNMEKYKEAVTSGVFAEEKLRSTLGPDADYDAIFAALQQQDNDIMMQETQDYNYKRLGEERQFEPDVAKFKNQLLNTPMNDPKAVEAYKLQVGSSAMPDRFKTELLADLDKQRTGDVSEAQSLEQYGWKKQEHANAVDERNYQLGQRANAQKLLNTYTKALGQSKDSLMAYDQFGEQFLKGAAPTESVLFEDTDGSGNLIPVDLGKVTDDQMLKQFGVDVPSELLANPTQKAEIANQLRQQKQAEQVQLTQRYKQSVNAARESGALMPEPDVASVRRSLTEGMNLSPENFELSNKLSSQFEEQANAVQTSLPVSGQREYASWYSTEQSKVKAAVTEKQQALELRKADMVARKLVVPEEEVAAATNARDTLESKVSNWENPNMSWGQWFVKNKDYEVGGREAIGWMMDWAKGDAAKANNDGQPYNDWVLLKAFDAATQGQDSTSGHFDKHVNLRELEKQMKFYQDKWQKSEDNRKALVELEHELANETADMESNLLRGGTRKLNQLKKQHRYGS